MWKRSILKERAKNVLRSSYWKALIISIILSTMEGGSSIGINVMNFGAGESRRIGGIYLFFIILIFCLIPLALLMFSIFIINPLVVGIRKYFLEASMANDNNEDIKINIIAFGFYREGYMPLVKAMFLKSIYLIGWTLLFIVPGIIKGYAYAMVPYILADNPEIGSTRAIELSNQMTNGEKWNMFVLDLSFSGWYIIGMLLCGIGIIFVNPYYNATHAELYRNLRQNALEQGLCTYEELNFKAPEL